MNFDEFRQSFENLISKMKTAQRSRHSCSLSAKEAEQIFEFLEAAGMAIAPSSFRRKAETDAYTLSPEENSEALRFLQDAGLITRDN